jgi:adenylosuccinate lyase
MPQDHISNVLAERYASPAMRAIWSGEGKVRLERDYWIAVLKGQRDLGIAVPDGVIESYERVKDQIDLASIMRRERITRHDVKARIEEFCDLAGHEHLHKGMTSRDLTENVEQLQVYRALKIVEAKSIAALIRFAQRARQWRDVPFTARTHNVAAQVTTLGKRIAMSGEEMLLAHQSLVDVLNTYPARGLKGAVGTRLDQITLFNGDAGKARALEQRILVHLGLPKALDAVGQVYPRSLDFRAVSVLTELASGPGNFAKTIRLMAGHELASEGFAKGQVGSSAMPHKMNSRSCERINGLHVILKGYLTMAAGLAGDQWNEGDVSCSVVRRVMLPDAFLAMDGLLETLLSVLDQMEVFEPVVETELNRYLPFLLTTTVTPQGHLLEKADPFAFACEIPRGLHRSCTCPAPTSGRTIGGCRAAWPRTRRSNGRWRSTKSISVRGSGSRARARRAFCPTASWPTISFPTCATAGSRTLNCSP